MKRDGIMRALDVPVENFDLIRGERMNQVRIRLYEVHGPVEIGDLPHPGEEPSEVDQVVKYSTYDIWEFDQSDLFDHVVAHFDWYLQKAKAKHDKDVAAAVRARRNHLLSLADVAVNKASDNGDLETNFRARDYRQALRDIPDQPGFPHDVQWPVL